MREHCVDEFSVRLSSRFEGSQKSDGFNASEDAEIAEENDDIEGQDRSKAFGVIYVVTNELFERKNLSDERLTEAYIKSRCIRGFEPIKLKDDLKNKGISSHLIHV